MSDWHRDGAIAVARQSAPDPASLPTVRNGADLPAVLDAGARALAQASDDLERLRVRDHARAVQEAARVLRRTEILVDASVLVARAERTIAAHNPRLTPAEIGARRGQESALSALDRKLLHKLRRAHAHVDDALFRALVAAARETGEPLSRRLIARAGREAARGPDPKVAHYSGEYEWTSPPHLVAAAKRVMGDIDLDPASSIEAQRVVQALRFYDERYDGLKHAWAGRVWLNPPYATPLVRAFVERLLDAVRDGRVTQGLPAHQQLHRHRLVAARGERGARGVPLRRAPEVPAPGRETCERQPAPGPDAHVLQRRGRDGCARGLRRRVLPPRAGLLPGQPGGDVKAARDAMLARLAASGISAVRSELFAACPAGTSDEVAAGALATLRGDGLIRSFGRRWVLTDAGREAADALPAADTPPNPPPAPASSKPGCAREERPKADGAPVPGAGADRTVLAYLESAAGAARDLLDRYAAYRDDPFLAVLLEHERAAAAPAGEVAAGDVGARRGDPVMSTSPLPPWLRSRFEVEARALGVSPDELRVYEDLLAEEMDRAELSAHRGETPGLSRHTPAPGTA